MYVIKKGHKYVALPGSKRSYTTSVNRAQKFYNESAAKANTCGDEQVVFLSLNW